MTPTISQHQYLANWHNSFVAFTGSLLGVVMGLIASPDYVVASSNSV